MKLKLSNLPAVPALILMLGMTTHASADIQNQIRRTFTVTPGGTLRLLTDTGSIEVQSSPGDKVDIQVILTADTSSRDKAAKLFKDFTLDAKQSGNSVIVRGRYDEGWGLFQFDDDLEAHFVITVPAQYNLDLETAGGNIRVSDIKGEVRTETSGGNLYLGRIDGPVSGNTSGGNVTVQGAVGKLLLRTSGGDITVGAVQGPVEARTSGGSIKVSQARGDVIAKSSGGNITLNDVAGSINAETSGGNMSASISTQPRSDSRLSTSGGNVTISLANTVSVDLDARSDGGFVTSDLPVTIQGNVEEQVMRGRINSGGPKLVLRTAGGNIKVRRIQHQTGM